MVADRAAKIVAESSVVAGAAALVTAVAGGAAPEAPD